MLEKLDIPQALGGRPAVTASGFKVYIRHIEVELDVMLGFYLDDRFDIFNPEWIQSSWAIDGTHLGSEQDGCLDVVGMWSQPIEFKYWQMLAKDVVEMEHISQNEWHLFYEGKEKLPVKIKGDYFMEGFFPRCPAGTKLNRPKKKEFEGGYPCHDYVPWPCTGIDAQQMPEVF